MFLRISLEIAEADLGVMSWNEAMDACAALGDGWKLPNKDELNLMYTNLKQKALGGFGEGWLWSSSQGSSNYAWVQRFSDGGQNFYDKYYRYAVRAVRTLVSSEMEYSKGFDDERKYGILEESSKDLTVMREASKQDFSCPELNPYFKPLLRDRKGEEQDRESYTDDQDRESYTVPAITPGVRICPECGCAIGNPHFNHCSSAGGTFYPPGMVNGSVTQQPNDEFNRQGEKVMSKLHDAIIAARGGYPSGSDPHPLAPVENNDNEHPSMVHASVSRPISLDGRSMIDTLTKAIVDLNEALSGAMSEIKRLREEDRWVDPIDNSVYYALTAKEYSGIWKEFQRQLADLDGRASMGPSNFRKKP